MADLKFLRTEPSRKQKQLVQTNGIHTYGDAKILESAVVDVLRFVGGLSLWQYPKYMEWVLSRATGRGAEVLQLPPKYGENKIVPLMIQRYSDWKIVADAELSVYVEFTDRDGGYLKMPPIVSWRMVFVKVDNEWKFDGYHNWFGINTRSSR